VVRGKLAVRDSRVLNLTLTPEPPMRFSHRPHLDPVRERRLSRSKSTFSTLPPATACS
jgi:hypothetical protein